MSDADFSERWRASHGLPSGAGGAWVGGWLRLVGALARPLARAGVPPTALTAGGLVLAWAGVGAAWAGGWWVLGVPVLVVACALADGLDGGVALLRGRASPWGAVVDAGADRLSEVAFGVVLWLLGAPAWLPLFAVALGWLLEYLRERAAGTVPAAAPGARLPVVLTVAERPTRVAVTAMFALAAGVFPDGAARWAVAGAAVWSVLGVVALVQTTVRWGRVQP